MNNLKIQDLNKGDQIGQEIYRLVSELYPICRSITGNGVRQTLDVLKKEIPLDTHEIPSGTQVFDWVVPKEWNVTDAYIKDSKGKRIIDFKQSNLHVVSYSVPVKKTMSLSELKPHLFSLPEYPEWIPYRTGYYKETWGFCLSHKDLVTLQDEEFDVCIESTLQEGSLTYGEYYLRGNSPEEILISCHICHPSLCNDNLSGIGLATILAKHLSRLSLKYSYRFLFIPATIGSITWLCLNEARVSRIQHGLVLANVGDSGHITYKKSRHGNAEIDQVVCQVLRHKEETSKIMDFSPYGYDERQYCSPGFNLPIGCLMRTPHGLFPEYHTSADNLEFVQPQYLSHSFLTLTSILEVLEHNTTYVNQNPKCEPQLGKRGLYRAMGGQKEGAERQLALLWILNLSDGSHTLLDIAERSGLPFSSLCGAAEKLLASGLLKECPK